MFSYTKKLKDQLRVEHVFGFVKQNMSDFFINLLELSGKRECPSFSHAARHSETAIKKSNSS